MSSAASSRSALRQSRVLLRQQFRQQSVRQASSTTEAAAKAKESTSSGISKASEGLSRVSSSAGPAISGAVAGAGNALRGVGGRTGRIIGFVDSLLPPTIYYSRVALELSKIVFKGQNMYPPNMSTFQSYYQPFVSSLRSPQSFFAKAGAQASSAVNTYSPERIMNSIRNVNSQQLAVLGVVGAEVLGFFTIGTMIGRMKLVGYRGDTGHGDH